MTKTTEKQKELTDLTCTRKAVDLDSLLELRKELNEKENIDSIARALDLAGNETRLRIIFLLAKAGELCVCDLSDVMGMSVSAISHQLRKLRDGHIVTYRKESPTIYYSLEDHPVIDKLVGSLLC